MIDAVRCLERAQLVARTRDSEGYRVWVCFVLTPKLANQLYEALANDPISSEDASLYARWLQDLARD